MNDRVIFKEVCDFLKFTHNPKLTALYINGLTPSILNYDKFETSGSAIPVIQRYLIGFESYILWDENPPIQYYEIARAVRHSLTIQFLHTKISQILKIKNHEERVKKLITTLSYDEFESILFELLVGASYAALAGVKSIEFIKETDTKKPDLLVVTDKEIYIECKRMNRLSDEAVDIRNYVRSLNAQFALTDIGKTCAVLIDGEFHTDPRKVSNDEWNKGCNHVVTKGQFSGEKFNLKCKRIEPEAYEGMMLFPSPQFYEDKYGFKEGPWQGFTQVGEFQYEHLTEMHALRNVASTLLVGIGNQVSLRWKILSDDALRAYRKINFGLLFKGLEQLKGYENTILHFAYERDKSAGHRQKSLMKLYQSMSEKQKDRFGWIIFNEIQYSVSRLGRRDLVEHAHPLSGPDQFTKRPLITNVFTEGDYDINEVSEFGVGQEVEDIDLVLAESDPHDRTTGRMPLKRIKKEVVNTKGKRK